MICKCVECGNEFESLHRRAICPECYAKAVKRRNTIEDESETKQEKPELPTRGRSSCWEAGKQ